MIQVKWYARGGQGGFTACRLMALAAVYHKDCYAQAFPSFGPERRGAPVYGFTRIDEKPIRDHSQIYTYDYGIVVDPTLMETLDVMKGLKEDGILFVNSTRSPEELGLTGGKVITFDADAVSMEILKSRISNTAMMAVAAIKSGLADEESMCRACRELLPPRILEGNLRLIHTVCEMMKEEGAAHE